MTISYSWLQEYLKTDIPALRAAEILTAAGLEIEGVENVETIRGGLSGLFVGEVVACEKHPDADKLHITRVDVGESNGGVLQIVCGAPNVALNQKVVVALVGSTLYPTNGADGFSIKKSKIRGVESFGMLCAEDEIGIGESHDGIIVLPYDTKTGTQAAEVFEIQGDTIFEVGLTPNRVDAASHYGVARDLAASLLLQGIKGAAKAELPSVAVFKAGKNRFDVRVENAQAAPRYMGVAMSGVRVAPSPEWLQNRLRSIGINPKNNIVDITNFVLHECGQPLHAFDLDRIEGRKIVVRTVAAGTKFITLDGVERTLIDDDLMICSAERPMCLAGVFGGMDSGVSDSTSTIFIESAYFNPAWVRRSAKRHSLSTDSSWRYERGADPDMLPYALKRCALLISELAGGVVDSEIVDIYPEKINPFCFQIDLERINSLIGKRIESDMVRTILAALEIKITREVGSVLDVEVPAYRVDVTREADVAEEILRLFGFNNIENPPFIKNVLTVGNRPTTDKMVDVVSNMFASLGLTEIMSNSLTKASYYDGLREFSTDKCVKILNPLSSELSVMRQTLAFNSLEAVALNSARRNTDLKLFEVGNCYFYNPDGDGLSKYSQQQHLAIAVTGQQSGRSWNAQNRASSFFSVKSLIEKLFDRFGLNFYEGSFSEIEGSDIFGSVAVRYTIRGGVLFEMGEINGSTLAKFDLKAPVFYAEINIEKLQKLVGTVRIVSKELNKFQVVKRDLALLVDTSVSFAMLREAAIKAEKKLLRDVSIFDFYQGDKLPVGKKSYALSFVIEDTSKTLTDGEIERIMSTIGSELQKMGAEIRS